VANGPYYGGGMCIAPGARVDDGRLDLCMVGEVSRWELVRQFPRVYRGTHVAHAAVVTASGRRIEVLANEGREIFADGEYVGAAPATIEVDRARLGVLL
jgi:diacylglycerol kinase (ATP)